MLSQHLPVEPLLLPREFAQGVLAHAVVAAGHAQRAAPLTGHAREALPPGEVIHGDTAEMHILRPPPLLSFEDGGGCRRKERFNEHLGQQFSEAAKNYKMPLDDLSQPC